MRLTHSYCTFCQDENPNGRGPYELVLDTQVTRTPKATSRRSKTIKVCPMHAARFLQAFTSTSKVSLID